MFYKPIPLNSFAIFGYFVWIVTLYFPMNVSAHVSLQDKIGQMLLIGFHGKKVNSKSPIVNYIEQGNIGGVLLFDYDQLSKTFDKNIESPKQVKQLNQDLQYFTHKAQIKHHRPVLPLFIAVDYEGGEVNRLSEKFGFPHIPSAQEVGRQGLKMAQATAQSMATTLKSAGFNLNFAPVLDVNVNADNPVIGTKARSFSKDADEVSRFAGVYSRYFLNHNLQCVYKHFPGHGSSKQDSHLGFVDVTGTWQANELKPYKQLINSKTACDAIMSAHIVNRKLDSSGLPATLSHKMLTELLRKTLHFKGLIITDDLQMKAIADQYGLEKALVLAINAGADVLIFGNNFSLKNQDPLEVIRIIQAKVQAGEISTQRIDEAYERIVALKSQLK